MFLKTLSFMAALLAMLVGASPAHAQTRPTELAVGTPSRTIFALPVWMAIERGYFQAEGLDVKVVVVTEGLDRQEQMLREGALRIAIHPPEAVIAGAQKAAPLVMIGGNAERLPHYIIAQPRIQSLSQLKGARIGVAGASDGTTSLMSDIAKAAGLVLSDLQLQVVGGAPTRWRLLQEGKIDVGLQPFPQSYEAEALGFRNLGAVLDIVPNYQFTALATDKAWATANRATTVAFLRALARGQAAMLSDIDGATSVAAREMRTSPEFAKRAIGDLQRMAILSRDLSVSRVALQHVFHVMKNSGRIGKDTTFDWAAYVDESLLAQSR